MAIECCDGFKVLANDDLISSRYNGCKVRLYKNNHTPAHGDTISSYTEADFDNYAPITLSSWPGSSLDGSFNAVSTHPDVVFSQTGTTTTNTIYGAYLTDAAGTYLIGAEANPNGPQSMNAAGLTYVVGVTVGENNQTPP